VTCTIAFANHKGGCGKITSVANTGAALASLGRRALVIDADPQANLSEAFGVAADHEGPRLEDAVDDEGELAPWSVALDDRAGHGGQLDLVPCTSRLDEALSRRVADPAAAMLLRDRLTSIGGLYDFVLVDTPPGPTSLSSMALLAADWVVVPARPADFDVGGALKLADLIHTDLRLLNPSLNFLGVLMTQVDRRWTLAGDTREALRTAGVHRLRVEIPFMVRTGAAPRHGAPTVILEPDSRVALAYHELAKDLAATLDREPTEPPR